MFASWFKRGDECSSAYTFGEVLGRGSFATVRRATRKGGDRGGAFPAAVAIKCIRKKAMRSGGDDLQQSHEALQNEMEAMRQLQHEHIVALIEVFDCSSTFYLVTELCTGGEVFTRLAKKSHYSEGEARGVLLQVNAALRHCHGRVSSPANAHNSSNMDGRVTSALAAFTWSLPFWCISGAHCLSAS